MTKSYTKRLEDLKVNGDLTGTKLAVISPKKKEKIAKRGGKFVVLSSDGKQVLGTHDTLKAAKKQLAAIEISKKKRG